MTGNWLWRDSLCSASQNMGSSARQIAARIQNRDKAACTTIFSLRKQRRLLYNCSSMAKTFKISRPSNSIRSRTASWHFSHWIDLRHDRIEESTCGHRKRKHVRRIVFISNLRFWKAVTNGFWWTDLLKVDKRGPCRETIAYLVGCWCCVVGFLPRQVWQKKKLSHRSK